MQKYLLFQKGKQPSWQQLVAVHWPNRAPHCFVFRTCSAFSYVSTSDFVVPSSLALAPAAAVAFRKAARASFAAFSAAARAACAAFSLWSLSSEALFVFSANEALVSLVILSRSSLAFLSFFLAEPPSLDSSASRWSFLRSEASLAFSAAASASSRAVSAASSALARASASFSLFLSSSSPAEILNFLALASAFALLTLQRLRPEGVLQPL
mmetsp:Transcript_141799/g.440876  ORF Transcript_141799/g.440876 Transcript_141799/m.440876 type:complete len:211 (+) Transcript_141799:647-1279(+)